MTDPFLEDVRDILRSNGWDPVLEAEIIEPDLVRVRKKSAKNPPDVDDVVNVYPVGSTPLEQVMQECLRFLRTGRIGA